MTRPILFQITSHKDCSRSQGAYTPRCSTQVHGARFDAARAVGTEMNSSTNTHLIFNGSGQFLLGESFHGHPLLLAMDFLGMAAVVLANISERRVERLVNPKLSG